MIGILSEIMLFLAKFFKIFKKKRKKKYGRVCLVIAAVVGAVAAALAICFIPSIFRVNNKDSVDAYGHLSHLKIRKEPNKNGKMKTKIKFKPIDFEKYAGEEK